MITDDAEAVDVGSAVDLAIARRLLGTHVVRRSDRHAGRRQRPRPGCRRERLRDAEVRQNRSAAAPLQQNVVGFDIAVDDAQRMSGTECVGRLHENAARLFGRQPLAPFEPGGE